MYLEQTKAASRLEQICCIGKKGAKWWKEVKGIISWEIYFFLMSIYSYLFIYLFIYIFFVRRHKERKGEEDKRSKVRLRVGLMVCLARLGARRRGTSIENF